MNLYELMNQDGSRKVGVSSPSEGKSCNLCFSFSASSARRRRGQTLLVLQTPNLQTSSASRRVARLGDLPGAVISGDLLARVGVLTGGFDRRSFSGV